MLCCVIVFLNPPRAPSSAAAAAAAAPPRVRQPKATLPNRVRALRHPAPRGTVRRKTYPPVDGPRKRRPRSCLPRSNPVSRKRSSIVSIRRTAVVTTFNNYYFIVKTVRPLPTSYRRASSGGTIAAAPDRQAKFAFERRFCRDIA